MRRDATISGTVQFTKSKLVGCFAVQFPMACDARGNLVKTIQRSVFEKQGLEADFQECFHSTSYENVLRGMHFQAPPSDHAKLIYCIAGAVCDMALDLRVGSPTYGQHEMHELSSSAANAVYLSRGVAHGFYVREGPAVTVYHAGSEYDPSRDDGIRWDSFEAAWPVESPILSQRDTGLISFKDFESPFLYVATGGRPVSRM